MKRDLSAGLAVFLQLLLMFAAIGQLLCVHSSLVEDGSKTVNGITSSLIHMDDYLDIGGLTHGQKRERDLRRNILRVQALYSRREALSGNPLPGGQNWQTPLSDAAASSYLMQISLGTPAKTFVAIADTGSDLTWLQCTSQAQACQVCSGFAISSDCGTCQGGVFDITQSSSYLSLSCSSSVCQFLNQSGSVCAYSPGAEPQACTAGAQIPGCTCPYIYGYGDGTETTGTIAVDTISLTTVNSSNIVGVDGFQFGCSNTVVTNTSLLQQNDGLVGLGRGNISFPSQLGTYFGYLFGYCLVNRTSSNKQSPLYFGKDATPQNSQTQYTPMIIRGSTFYYVNCTGISLNGNNISAIPASAFDITPNGTSGGLFLDSGTTYTTLWDTIMTPLVAALVEKITKYRSVPASEIPQDLQGFPLCFYADWSDWIDDEGGAVPIISFQFVNTSGFNLTADAAWFPYTAQNSLVCLAMQSTSNNMNIFGSTQQVNYQIVYDIGKEKIGFVPAICHDIPNSRSNSLRSGASVFTSLVTGLVSLLLLLVFNQ